MKRGSFSEQWSKRSRKAYTNIKGTSPTNEAMNNRENVNIYFK